jgi:hypothetical protein
MSGTNSPISFPWLTVAPEDNRVGRKVTNAAVLTIGNSVASLPIPSLVGATALGVWFWPTSVPLLGMRPAAFLPLAPGGTITDLIITVTENQSAPQTHGTTVIYTLEDQLLMMRRLAGPGVKRLHIASYIVPGPDPSASSDLVELRLPTFRVATDQLRTFHVPTQKWLDRRWEEELQIKTKDQKVKRLLRTRKPNWPTWEDDAIQTFASADAKRFGSAIDKSDEVKYEELTRVRADKTVFLNEVLKSMDGAQWAEL